MIDISEQPIESMLPDAFGKNDQLPDDFKGAEITRLGTFKSGEFDGGPLVIEYRKKGASKLKRVVFDFNELGMWTSSCAYIDDPTSVEDRES